MLADLKPVPAHDLDPSFYVDWSDAREYSVGDIGVGECAGEVITSTVLELTEAEGEAFEAQVALDEGDLARSDERAYDAMLKAAWALVRTEWSDVPQHPDVIVREFQERFAATGRIKPQFTRALIDRHTAGAPEAPTSESARILADEAQLLIDAVHQFEIREAGATGAVH